MREWLLAQDAEVSLHEQVAGLNDDVQRLKANVTALQETPNTSRRGLWWQFWR